MPPSGGIGRNSPGGACPKPDTFSTRFTNSGTEASFFIAITPTLFEGHGAAFLVQLKPLFSVISPLRSDTADPTTTGSVSVGLSARRMRVETLALWLSSVTSVVRPALAASCSPVLRSSISWEKITASASGLSEIALVVGEALPIENVPGGGGGGTAAELPGRVRTAFTRPLSCWTLPLRLLAPTRTTLRFGLPLRW